MATQRRSRSSSGTASSPSHVVILAGGVTVERQVSLASAEAVAATLIGSGRRVAIVEVTEHGRLRMLDQCEARLTDIGHALVPFPGEDSRHELFYANLVHGDLGEDGRLQALLELHDVPHCGSSSVALAGAFDKSRYIEFLRAIGIAVPRRAIFGHHLWPEVESRCQELVGRVPGPWVVKPAVGGSSVGLTIVHDAADLVRELQERMLSIRNLVVEEYLPGVEVTVGVLGARSGRARTVGPVTWAPDGSLRTAATAPVRAGILDPYEVRRCVQLAVQAYAALGLNGFATLDMRLRDGCPHLIDCNAIPGLTSSSPLVLCSELSGYDYGEVCDLWLSCINEWRPQRRR
jgi:D-alanine-D-alanine ligase